MSLCKKIPPIIIELMEWSSGNLLKSTAEMGNNKGLSTMVVKTDPKQPIEPVQLETCGGTDLGDL